MPSPFPGMDPYLEGELWTMFHTHLAVVVAGQLMPKVVPRYVAVAQKRFTIDVPDEVDVVEGDTYPDVGMVRASPAPFAPLGAAAVTAPLEMETVLPENVPHVWVEIRDTARRDLVTAIEFLSPTNKRGEGRREYLDKRRRLLLSSSHLLEIDLLRQGRRVPMQEPLPAAPYFVFLSRAGKRPRTEVWPVGLDHPLPPVPIPLAGDDPDVTLDLQKAFTDTYDACRCDLLVDYKRPPEPPLPPEGQVWAEELLCAAGLRP